MAKIIPYNPKLKALARKLRADMTFGEVLLWNELKKDKMLASTLTGNVVWMNISLTTSPRKLWLTISTIYGGRSEI
jgi:hypothetical protein